MSPYAFISMCPRSFHVPILWLFLVGFQVLKEHGGKCHRRHFCLVEHSLLGETLMATLLVVSTLLWGQTFHLHHIFVVPCVGERYFCVQSYLVVCTLYCIGKDIWMLFLVIHIVFCDEIFLPWNFRIHWLDVRSPPPSNENLSSYFII